MAEKKKFTDITAEQFREMSERLGVEIIKSQFDRRVYQDSWDGATCGACLMTLLAVDDGVLKVQKYPTPRGPSRVVEEIVVAATGRPVGFESADHFAENYEGGDGAPNVLICGFDGYDIPDWVDFDKHREELKSIYQHAKNLREALL